MPEKFSIPLKLSVFYLLISACWIIGTDSLSESLAGADPSKMQQFQSYKGLFFVLACSVFIFYISKKFYTRVTKSLRQSEEMLARYMALGEATKEAIVDHDLEMDIAQVNLQMQGYLEEAGSSVQHFTYKIKNRIHPDDRQNILKNFRDTLESGSSFWQGDFRFRLQDNLYHDVSCRGTIIHDSSGRPARFISVLQDVTELRNFRTVFYEQQIRHAQLVGQHIIKAQEAERNRWSEELHDNVGQLLTVVKLYHEMMESDQEFNSELLGRSRLMTQKALDEIRHLSAAVKPPEFSHFTLRQSIDSLIANISRIKSFNFVFELDDTFETALLTDEQKLMIYRIVQEQLNNIIKYAEASRIRISINASDDNISVVVDDNGKGFDPSKVQTGIGLRNIRSRLQVYSGVLQISSAPGEGCCLTAAFSLS